MSDPRDDKNEQPEIVPVENPQVRKRIFGRGVYGSKDVPIKILDICILVMIVAAVAITLFNARHGGFTVTFDTGVDDVAVAAEKAEYQKPVSEPGTVTRPGYELSGWTTAEGGKTLWDFDTDKVETSMTLYAVWTPAQIVVKFDLAGAPETLEPIEVTYGETYGSLPTPVWEGRSFAGWTYSGGAITADTKVAMPGEHVLTAVWE